MLASKSGGGGGIRTLGTGFSQCNCLAGSSVKPLRHPSAGNGLLGSVYYRASAGESNQEGVDAQDTTEEGPDAGGIHRQAPGAAPERAAAASPAGYQDRPPA